MSDKLFNQFASSQNLKKAFKYVKLEVEQSTLPLDPFWTPGMKAIDRLGDAFFNSLSKLLLENKYNPDDICFFHQHKENYGVRKLAMITAVDRIVYQAIFSPDILGLQLSNSSRSFSCYPGVIMDEDRYLEHYKKPYKQYWDFQESFYEDDGMVFRGEYDIHCFFDNISHHVLFEQLEKNKIGSEKIRLLLKKMLSKWFANGRGIPQGPQTSSVIANYYLSDLDDIKLSMSSKEVGYVRYMDDISIMAKTEQSLLKWVEILTYKLDEMGLVLNSKTKKEKIHNVDYFKDKGIAPYQAIYEFSDRFFIESILNTGPTMIGNLTRGKSLTRAELSKFKYFLKANQEYSLAKEILLLYPHLPSFADTIARYIYPINNEAWVQTLIFELLNKHHLFRWQKLWLVKLLLIEKAKGSLEYSEIDFRKDKNWELRSMAWLAKVSSGGNISIKKLSQLVEQSENIFELAIYLSLVPMLKDKKTKTILNNYIDSSSLEIKVVTKSLMFNEHQLANCTQYADLFVNKGNGSLVKDNSLTKTMNENLELILGFSPRTTHPKKRFVFELKTVGQEIVMLGSILNGHSLPAFKSKRTSTFRRIIRTLLGLHERKAKEVFDHYSYPKIKDVHISDSNNDELDGIDLVKDKRLLAPLYIEFFDLLTEQGHNKNGSIISFRCAIDEDAFDLLDDERRKKIASLAREALDFVK